MDKLLKLLSENARFTDKQLAAMLALSEGEVKEKIEECERLGIINGYHALINWQSVDPQYVSAIIEVKVSPKRDYGFDEIARVKELLIINHERHTYHQNKKYLEKLERRYKWETTFNN